MAEAVLPTRSLWTFFFIWQSCTLQYWLYPPSSVTTCILCLLTYVMAGHLLCQIFRWFLYIPQFLQVIFQYFSFTWLYNKSIPSGCFLHLLVF